MGGVAELPRRPRCGSDLVSRHTQIDPHPFSNSPTAGRDGHRHARPPSRSVAHPERLRCGKAPMQHRLRTVVAALAVATLGGCTSPNTETQRANPATREGPPTVVSEAGQAAPVTLSIPALDLAGGLTRTGLTDENALEVPEFGEMSWFEDGVTPGASGPAAILGHVDSRSGPDVFHRLDELSPGDEIFVDSAAGETLVFVVRKVEQHPKDSFPTEAVWLPTPDRELRLITCGGAFDDRVRSYRDNVIVFASLRPDAPGT